MTLVPVLRWPTVSTTSNSLTLWPSAKAIRCTSPLRLILTSRAEVKALTTEMPTPWSPPENW